MYSVSSVFVWRYITFEKKRKQQYYTFYFKRLKGAFLTNTLHLQWIMILYACHKPFFGPLRCMVWKNEFVFPYVNASPNNSNITVISIFDAYSI